MIHDQNQNVCTKSEPLMTLFIFRHYGHDVTMKTSLTHTYFLKNFVNTNWHAKFDVPEAFGLGVRSGAVLPPFM